jgi:hypothetical protein
MAHFVFTCPTTSMKVQHWSDESIDVPETEYDGVVCQACTKLHFINRKTGKLLGQDDDQAGASRGDSELDRKAGVSARF